ncbi:MAG: CoA transferase, partial [Halioglobus sp.]|nr:CoA transferase [Halioglobus sp.]
MTDALGDLRVIDFSTTIAGSYATKMLADAGAEVIKVEPPEGDPLRRWCSSVDDIDLQRPDDAALFRFLNTSKQSIVGSPGDAAVQELVAGADLVVNTFAPAQYDVEALAAARQSLVVLSITPWGRTGPYSQRPVTEFIVQAESGSLSQRGLPVQPPVMAGGRITEWVGGTFAAVAALAACRHARNSGRGDHIDFSLLEVMNIAGTNYADLLGSLMKRPELTAPVRSVEVPSIEPTKDGWVGFNTNSQQQYTDFLLLIERTDLLAEEDLASIVGRMARMDEWNAAVRAWTTQRTTAEIVEAAALLRIPVAPVNNGKTVLQHEHFRERGVFVENPGGGFEQPRPPYHIHGTERPVLRQAPALGEHTGKVRPRAARTVGKAEAAARPLAGIRVLDATAWWAGPSATQMLAHLGAEVIHMEAIQRLDGMRMFGGRFVKKPRWWEYSAMFLGANSNKRGLTLDLDQPEGLEAAKELIGQSDVFVENYSPRVMDKFGLDWSAVHALSPATIMVRMPAFGLDGPWRDRVGFAQTMEQITGMAWITGHVDDQPRIQRGPCDPLAGMNAAFGALVALGERERTGKGSLVESAMVEGALNAAAEQIVEFSAYGRVMHRAGNRCPQAAPQGLYACAGHVPASEQWLALSIESDAQWAGLIAALGNPAAFADERFATLAGRHACHDEIDAMIAGLVTGEALAPLIERLVAHGVPAGEVQQGMDVSAHPQFVARGFFETLEHPVVGTHPFVTPPFTSVNVGVWLHSVAPVVG